MIKSQNLLDQEKRNINSTVISLNDAKGISKLITKKKSKSSAGNDEISNKILKLCSPIIDPCLAEGINQAIENKHFPDCLKIAKVNSVFKKGTTDDTSKYRPISLLGPISKVFERVLCKKGHYLTTKTDFSILISLDSDQRCLVAAPSCK